MIKTLNEMMLQTGVGVLYLDDEINVVGSNEAANEMLKRQDDVWRRGSELFFRDGCIKKKLIASIKNLTTGSSSLFIKRAIDKPPLKMSVFSCRDDIRGLNGAVPVSVLLVTDTQEKGDLCIESIVEHYSLTKAEVALVTSLYRGKSLRQHARDRGIKITTARWTLDNIFSKTYTSSQSSLKELVDKFSK